MVKSKKIEFFRSSTVQPSTKQTQESTAFDFSNTSISSLLLPAISLERENFLQEIKEFIKTANAYETVAIYNAVFERKDELVASGTPVLGKVSYSHCKTKDGREYWIVQWREGKSVHTRYVGEELPPYDALTFLRKLLKGEKS